MTFGAGKQIEAHLDLHLRSFASVKSCTLVNRTLNARVQDLQARLTSRFPNVSFSVLALPSGNTTSTEDLRAAVGAASLIICATSSTIPLFPSSWVRTGTHVVLIGSYTPAMREVDRVLIRRAIPAHTPSPGEGEAPLRQRQVLLVDSRDACAIEAGELIDAGIAPAEVVEIGERVELDYAGGVVLKGLAVSEMAEDSTRGADGDWDGPITLFKSVGVGLQDVAIACAVVAKAQALGIGTIVARYD